MGLSLLTSSSFLDTDRLVGRMAIVTSPTGLSPGIFGKLEGHRSRALLASRSIAMLRRKVSLVAVVLPLGCMIAGVGVPSVAADAPQHARNRLVRVVTVSQDALSTAAGEQRLNATLARLDQASGFEADIVCLPENVTLGAAEAVAGRTAKRVGEWAAPAQLLRNLPAPYSRRQSPVQLGAANRPQG